MGKTENSDMERIDVISDRIGDIFEVIIYIYLLGKIDILVFVTWTCVNTKHMLRNQEYFKVNKKKACN